jgi:hypothetical protein
MINLADLRAMPDEELVRCDDQMAVGTPPDPYLFREELNRRAYVARR